MLTPLNRKFIAKIEITTYPDCYYLYREAEPNSNQSFSKNLNKLISLLQKTNPYLDYDIAYFQYMVFTMPMIMLLCSWDRSLQ